MVFYDNLQNKDNGENKSEQLKKEREQIKKHLSKTLKEQGFSAKDVGRVIGLIDEAEEEIQKIKDSLIGTNINNTDDDPNEKLYIGTNAIHERQIKLGKDIKEMVAKIRQEKGL